MKIQIYSLKCPIENKIKYIGKTKNSLASRLCAHLSYSGDNIEKTMWVKMLRNKNLKPIIELVEFCEEYNWEIRERHWIEYHLSKGEKLLNQDLDKNSKFFLIKEYVKELVRLNYSEETIINYKSNFTAFVFAFDGHIYSEIKKEKIILYLSSLVEQKNISTSHQNGIINAIKFYFEKILGKPRETYYIKRPRREEVIRPILSPQQIFQLLTGIDNLKHRTALTLMYSCAMRSSEVVATKVSNLSFENETLIIQQAKGKKDRQIIVPSQTLELIKSYVEQCAPQYWLFEGQHKGEHWSQRSLQEVFNQQKIKNGFDERLRAHDLRHSITTHRMNAGMKIETAAKLLGHKGTSTIDKTYYHHDLDVMREQMAMADVRIFQKIDTQQLLPA